MRKTAIQVIKGRKVERTVRERSALYEESCTRHSIAQFQTMRFNDVWAKALQESPFYRDWAKQHSLPQQIKHIRDVAAFPVLKKSDLVQSSEHLLGIDSKSFYVSGGSTGEPTKFPKGKNEDRLRYANRVVTYSWLGLSPGERYVHLWGHAHLFGQGKLAVLRKHVRKSKDWLVGGHRINVYNQSESHLRNWVETIASLDPKFLVGYASALVNLARGIEKTTGTIKVRGLRWIISTAETLSLEEKGLLENVFGVPVAIEYGAIEAGLIAHSRPRESSGLHVLWGSLSGNVNEMGNLRISTLDPRAFPLINYEIGDRIHDPDDEEQVLSFGSIVGRTRDQLSLKMLDGTIGRISVIAVVGSLKNIETIRTVQAAQIGEFSVEIYVTSDGPVDVQKVKMMFLSELRKTGVHANATGVTVRQLEEPVKSIAGKTNLVVPQVRS